jgi:hypothetical protein
VLTRGPRISGSQGGRLNFLGWIISQAFRKRKIDNGMRIDERYFDFIILFTLIALQSYGKMGRN